MTERSILAGKNPIVVIKVGASVTVKGHDSDLVTAVTTGIWGLKLEKRSDAEIGRARAAVGDHVLFDIRLKKPDFQGTSEPEDVIEVQMGGGGEVLVPFQSTLKVYAGMNIDVSSVQGQVDGYTGLDLSLQDVYCLGHASAGGKMNIDCQTMLENNAEFKSGRDLRFHVHDLTSAHLRVKDLGGYWEARIGAGERSVYLKSGGDVTLVTDQKVEPLPPDYILGKIEKPAVS